MKINEVLEKRDLISISSTAIIWLILLVLAIVVKPEQKNRYEVIQLIFEEEKIEKIPEPIKEHRKRNSTRSKRST